MFRRVVPVLCLSEEVRIEGVCYASESRWKEFSKSRRCILEGSGVRGVVTAWSISCRVCISLFLLLGVVIDRRQMEDLLKERQRLQHIRALVPISLSLVDAGE